LSKVQRITVAGAGILGLWQALLLARAGHRVRLLEASRAAFSDAQSRLAGAMLAPYCEAEAAGPLVRDLGREGLRLWREVYPGLVDAGTLVVANTRDGGELTRFARRTTGHYTIEQARLAELEPDLASRFARALFYAEEAHVVTPRAMPALLQMVRQSGAEVRLGEPWTGSRGEADVVVDCRGMEAKGDLPSLRGVRGERMLVHAGDISLRRPVRLLHPRYPLYVVPWGDGVHLIGATLIESEDGGPVTVRSALELLGMAYALHPAFGEAQIIEHGAGVRPAFPDNIPRAIVRGWRIHVNGAYRHGFLLAPVLAQAVVDHLAGRATHAELIQPD
jgi:glycine oxidase